MTIRRGNNIIAGAYNLDEYATKTDLNGKANLNLNNSTAITNCITEIPQDIKLELNNGVLTLKAGSKVYVPNGFESDGTTPKFDVVVTNIDISLGDVSQSASEQRILIYNSNGTLGYLYASFTNSGSASSPSNVNWLWYDTTNNFIKRTSNKGSTWSSGASFPLCLFTITNGTGVTSIDQVFNGFGYIGSTVFALPGVKGLIPNGRNADGSLKNVEYVNDRVKTFTLLNSETCILNLYDGTMGIDISTYTLSNVFIQNNTPTNYQYMLWLDTLNNEFKYTENTGNSWVRVNLFNCAKIVLTTNGKITSFTPKTAFHAMDRNDSSWLSGLGMPSSRYINLTLLASGATYTAPANGYFFFSKQATAVNQEVYIAMAEPLNELYAWESIVPVSGKFAQITVPVKKGYKYKVLYTLAGATAAFRFIYAEGEN